MFPCAADDCRFFHSLWRDVNKSKPEAIKVLTLMRRMNGDKKMLEATRLANRWSKLDEGMKFRSFVERWSVETISKACDDQLIPMPSCRYGSLNNTPSQ